MYIAVHKSKHLHSFNFWCPQVSSQMFCSLQLSLDIDTDTSNTSFESLYHRWRSRLISECRHAIRTRDVTHGMLQVARIESVSSAAQTKAALPQVSFELTQALKIAQGVLCSTTCATATALKKIFIKNFKKNRPVHFSDKIQILHNFQYEKPPFFAISKSCNEVSVACISHDINLNFGKKVEE